ncbi:MAG: hypothetical protein ACE5J9_01070 [Methanosarcinales archaeon]
MKYIIDIPKHLLDETRKILAKGEYSNMNDLIITALENQIILEEGDKIQEDLLSTAVKVTKSVHGKAYEKKEQQDFSKWISLKSFNNIKTFPIPEIKELEYPNTKYKDLWLWGQINRIFSIKLGLRILGNMQQENGDFILLRDFLKKAGEIARGFGWQLERIDNQLKRKRDERVSTALPIGENEEKAVLRYITHFLANKRTDNLLDGAMARLKFVNIQKLDERGDLIGLTDEGLEFTKLKNPILDENLYSKKTLSEGEMDFYLRHIINNVPEELNPFSHILEIIKNGANSVTEIDKEIKKIKQKWTDIVITTQRSGALGRMNELGLLDKEKKGIKVIYKVSDKGENFLNKIKN